MTTLRAAAVPVSIPGPVGSALLGSVSAFRRDMPTALLDGLHRYGNVVAYRFGPHRPRWLRRDIVAIHHPDDIRAALTNGQLFGRQTAGFEVLAEIIGDGLLTSNGEVWLRQRRTVQPLFTPRRVAGYTALMAAEAQRIIAEPPGTGGSAVDLHELMQVYTLRVVGRALFGDDVDDAVPALRRLVPLAGDLAMARTRELARTPLHWPTPRNHRLRRARAELYAIVDGILAARPPQDPNDDRDDLVSRLRTARDPQTGQPLSEQEIRDQVLVFLLAGHETTAGALTFTLYLLGLHPDIQEEVAAACADQGDRPDLVQATLHEGMRLFPPVHVMERVTTEETELGGYPVPAGTMVLAAPWVTHRHPAFWPEPDRFDPHRFLAAHNRPRYAYFPFGGGPRSCVGEHFAMLEATVLLRAVLSRVRITALDAQVPLQPQITLRPGAPVRAVLHRR